jgi:integrase
MTRQWQGFSSPLASAFEQFLGHKRALGRRFRVEESVLRLFDRFLIVQSVRQLHLITPQVVDAFLASRPRVRPRSYNHLRGALVRFFEWSVAQGHVSSSPVQAPPRRVTGQRVPFIFDPPTARRLLEIAKALPDNASAPCRGQTYYTIFAVLYGLGLRVGEVSRLTIADVDLDRRLGHSRNEVREDPAGALRPPDRQPAHDLPCGHRSSSRAARGGQAVLLVHPPRRDPSLHDQPDVSPSHATPPAGDP